MILVRYSCDKKEQWDTFVESSKNGHFFYNRDYMDYHKDRFQDHSFMVYDNDKLRAVLPANVTEETLYTHQGLTFGGFIVDSSMTVVLMLEIFELLLSRLADLKIKKLIYKCIPYIYCINPSEEDRYSLFRNEASLVRRDVTTTINLQNRLKYSSIRKKYIKKANKAGLTFSRSDNYEEYWKLLNSVLEKYDTKAVHSIEEIQRLQKLFPENIKLYVAKSDSEILAGTVIYENKKIAHTQYLATSIYGKKVGALDFILDKLINEIYVDKEYFDFGISNEDNGHYLNEGLISQKESFGARAVMHDVYQIEIA
ncbi:MAG: GNAT family N-acetyltransferase [Candidatus Cloacimonetes bacterium]|nr:GNAT family N-acetyltransferase [Candidatus Cloacimonadota bacterium]